MDSKTQTITAREKPDSSHAAGGRATPLQPSQLKVEEKLYYRACIADRTEVSLQEATGKIEILFPARSPVVYKSGQKVSSSKDTAGYLALTNYNATVWHPPLRDDGSPLKLPLKSPSPEIETRSSASFSYALKPEKSRISTEPVRLEVKIVDRSSETVEQPDLEFVEGLRLELSISSEVDAFSEVEEEKIANLLRSQIKNLKKKQEQLRQHPEDETEPKRVSLFQKIQSGSQKLLEQQPPQSSPPSDEGSGPDPELERLQRIQQKCEKLLKDRERNLLRKREFLSDALNLLTEHPLSDLNEKVSHLDRKVKLAYLELKSPYICRSNQTKVWYRSSGDWLAVGVNKAKQMIDTAWQYNPERSALELREHSLRWNNDTKLYEMQVYFDLDPPTEGAEQIFGSAVLYLDEPISDMKVGWSANKKDKVDYELTDYRTWLVLDFEINFADVFRKRSYLLERRLHFEGVVFQPDHITNIRNILKNQGLVIFPVADMSPSGQADSENKQTIINEITAVRQGPELDVINLRMTGHISKGTHTITYNRGEEKLSKTMPLGTLDITLRARMARQSQAINQLLNTLQMNLEQLFTSTVVSSVKEEE